MLNNFTKIFNFENLEEKQQLKAYLEAKIIDTYDQHKQTMKSYNEMNEDRQRQFIELKDKDESSAKEIDKQMKKIQVLTVLKNLIYP